MTSEQIRREHVTPTMQRAAADALDAMLASGAR
jgi:hypothetical protein